MVKAIWPFVLAVTPFVDRIVDGQKFETYIRILEDEKMIHVEKRS